MENTHTNTDYTHNRVIIKKRGGGHKGGGDGNRVQGRVIHIKEEETGTGLKGGLVTHVL